MTGPGTPPGSRLTTTGLTSMTRRLVGHVDFDRVIDGIPGVPVERVRELAVGLARWEGFGPDPGPLVMEHYDRIIRAVLAPTPKFAPTRGQWTGRWGT